MTTDEAKSRIEAMFGSVNFEVADSRYIVVDSFSTLDLELPKPYDGPDTGIRLIFKVFTQDGEHVPFDDANIKMRDTPEEALADMIEQVSKVSDKDAMLYWRQYPTIHSAYDITKGKQQYSAACRLAWWKS